VDSTAWALLLGLSFLPPVLFALWVRAHEKQQREPVLAVLGMVLYGGTLGVLFALLLSGLLGAGYTGALGLSPALFAVVLVAPLGEELAKGLGLGWVRHRILEPEDGIVYGAAIGLGFAATENLLYGLAALDEGTLTDALVTIGFRIVSSTLLHAGSSALLGYGVALARLSGGGAGRILPFYLLAVAQHSLYLRRRIRTLDAAGLGWQRVG
jgi:protease PrsW